MKSFYNLYKKLTAIILVKIALVFLPIDLFALALTDHEKLTKIAIKEFFQCVQPEMLFSLNDFALNSFTSVLVNGNLQEDTNYPIKMVQYSHYYNPNFYVNVTWGYVVSIFHRCPSNYRIHHLEQVLGAYLQGNRLSISDLFWDDQCQSSSFLPMTDVAESFFQLSSLTPPSILDFRFFYANSQTRIFEIYRGYFDQLGHAIHHLQDMSSPAHVVPILHPTPSLESFRDRFEYNDNRITILDRIDSEFGNQSTDQMCAFKESPSRTLFDILDQSAKNTLDALNQEVLIHVLKSESNNGLGNIRRTIPKTVTWGNWYDKRSAVSSSNYLGQYGVYQDAFGLTEFQIDDDPHTPENEEGWTVYVNQRVYDDFTYQQYRQAIEDTKKALYYAYLHITGFQQNLANQQGN